MSQFKERRAILLMGTDLRIGMELEAMEEFPSKFRIRVVSQPRSNKSLRPNHFLAISKLTLGSIVQNLNIKNWPVHCFSISSTADTIFRNIYLDNTDGNAPNYRSNGLPAGHNSDGFDMSGSNNSIITNSTVLNQDDCVAVTSGNNITVSNMYCSGGHGISIGSVGGKSNNNVTNILVSKLVYFTCFVLTNRSY